MERMRGMAARLVAGVAAMVVIAGWPCSARAADEPEYARTGPYAGIGMIYAPGAFDVDGAERALPPATQRISRSIATKNSFGLDARAGYRLDPHVAAEADYQYLPGYEFELSNGGRLSDLTAHTLTFNGKLYAMTDRLQPYFVGGIGFVHTNVSPLLGGFEKSGTGFTGRVGAGADYYLRPDLVLNLEFSAVLTPAPLGDVRFLPLVFGAQYRFCPRQRDLLVARMSRLVRRFGIGHIGHHAKDLARRGKGEAVGSRR